MYVCMYVYVYIYEVLIGAGPLVTHVPPTKRSYLG